MKLLWKLLRQHLSVLQLGGFALANLVGMVIILLSIQFYNDILPLFQGNDTFLKKEYLILSKPVSTMGIILGNKGTFSAKEIEDIRRQPFAQSVGIFQSSQFKVSASLSMQNTGINVGTEMFFESVPDRYIDVTSDRWQYVSGSRSIPIIIPRNYLNLYNFGFAQSRSLPKISEGLLSMIRLRIRLSGNGRTEDFDGQIIGFSDRLNTILVPQTFLTWANTRFAASKQADPSRLIVEVANPADGQLAKYIQEQCYEVEGNQLDAGKTTWFLRIFVGIVAAIGLVITLLSFYILMLGIFLLLQKDLGKLQNLLLIGYSPTTLAIPYQFLAVSLNAVICAIAILFVWLLRSAYLASLSALLPSSETDSMWPVGLIGIGLFLIVSVINTSLIRQNIRQIWKIK